MGLAYDRGLNFRAERQKDGNVWFDINFGIDCFAEFLIDEEGTVTFHGLDVPGMSHGVGAKDPIGGTPITGALAEQITDAASRLMA